MLTMATGEFDYGNIFFDEDPVRFKIFCYVNLNSLYENRDTIFFHFKSIAY